MCDSQQRKVIILGQSGAGKSTLLNVVYNQSASRDALERPAPVGHRASGVTSEISNYITQSGKLFLTDTIGFDDNRFEPEALALEMRRVFRASHVGFTHIILVLPLGRITRATRIYLAMLDRLFGTKYKENLFVFIGKCDNGIAVETVVEDNKDDPDVGLLFVDLLNAPKDRRRIVTGSLMCHENLERDRFHHQDRMDTLDSINSFLRVDLLARHPPAGNPIEMITDFVRYVMNRFYSAQANLSAVLQNFRSDTMTITTHYPMCNICMSDEYTMENKPIQVQCGHIFHYNCVETVDSDSDPDVPIGCLPRREHYIKCPNCTMSVRLPGQDLMPSVGA